MGARAKKMEIIPIINMTFYLLSKLQTLSVHFLTILINSAMTISTHLIAGDRKRSICFFTIASNAMSGVNKPDLTVKMIECN